MNYIYFFWDERFIYCYSYDDNKIYRGVNTTKKSGPSLRYLLSMTFALYFGKALDAYFQDKLTDTLCMVMIMIGISIALVVGYIWTDKSERKFLAKSGLREIFLPKEQMQDYIAKGKKQFLIQIVILLSVFVSSFLLFVLFLYLKIILLWFSATMLCFAFTSALLLIKPIQKYKFYISKSKT